MYLPAESFLTQVDIVYAILAILFFGLIAYFYKRFFRSTDPRYKFFVPGLIVKMFGGFAFVLIYTYYYKGGDTHSYFAASSCLSKLTWIYPWQTLQMLFGIATPELRSYFDYTTGVPFEYIFIDSRQWSVCRLAYPFVLISGNRFILATVLMDVFAYIGIWQFYLMLGKKYPNILGRLALAAILIPSVVFWGSGILKDTFTFSATLWLIAAFNKAFIEKKDSRNQLFIIIMNAYVIISIKPYIFAALFPALILWLGIGPIYRMKNRILKAFSGPLIILLIAFSGLLLFTVISPALGKYGDLDSTLKKAEVTKKELTQAEYYSENYYDIGEFEATIPSVLSRFPLAIWYGMFGPFLWDARSPVLLISALESTVFLLLAIWIVLRTKIKSFAKILKEDDYLIFALCFSILFLFFVGLSSGNYGALVRYRIPGIPIFASFLAVVSNRSATSKKTTFVSSE